MSIKKRFCHFCWINTQIISDVLDYLRKNAEFSLLIRLSSHACARQTVERCYINASNVQPNRLIQMSSVLWFSFCMRVTFNQYRKVGRRFYSNRLFKVPFPRVGTHILLNWHHTISQSDLNSLVYFRIIKTKKKERKLFGKKNSKVENINQNLNSACVYANYVRYHYTIKIQYILLNCK